MPRLQWALPFSSRRKSPAVQIKKFITDPKDFSSPSPSSLNEKVRGLGQGRTENNRAPLHVKPALRKSFLGLGCCCMVFCSSGVHGKPRCQCSSSQTPHSPPAGPETPYPTDCHQRSPSEGAQGPPALLIPPGDGYFCTPGDRRCPRTTWCYGTAAEVGKRGKGEFLLNRKKKKILSLTFKTFPSLDIILAYYREISKTLQTPCLWWSSTKSTRFLSSPSGKRLSLLFSCNMPTFSTTFLQLSCTWCCRANTNSQALQLSPFTPPSCLHF